MGSGFTYDYLSQTGMDAFKGADVLKTVPEKYDSSIEYGNNPVARYVKMMAQTIIGDVGTRILYNTSPYNSFDLHGQGNRVLLSFLNLFKIVIIMTKLGRGSDGSGNRRTHRRILRGIPLDDPRIDRTKRHKLLDIVTIALCATICGADSWVDIELFGNCKEEWFKSFLELPNGIPSHDTFGDVFARLDPEQFQPVSWSGSKP